MERKNELTNLWVEESMNVQDSWIKRRTIGWLNRNDWNEVLRPKPFEGNNLSKKLFYWQTHFLAKRGSVFWVIDDSVGGTKYPISSLKLKKLSLHLHSFFQLSRRSKQEKKSPHHAFIQLAQNLHIWCGDRPQSASYSQGKLAVDSNVDYEISICPCWCP